MGWSNRFIPGESGPFQQFFHQKSIDANPLNGYMNSVKLKYLDGLPNRKGSIYLHIKKSGGGLFRKSP